jgi:hypothetical protein
MGCKLLGYSHGSDPRPAEQEEPYLSWCGKVSALHEPRFYGRHSSPKKRNRLAKVLLTAGRSSAAAPIGQPRQPIATSIMAAQHDASAGGSVKLSERPALASGRGTPCIPLWRLRPSCDGSECHGHYTPARDVRCGPPRCGSRRSARNRPWMTAAARPP